ncbi:MAG: GNAT family N-acetyltransferase [Dehalococcoidia bacterium]|nr:GNAT family N-acetyltransferase [Dehalococcoidia bacterium]
MDNMQQEQQVARVTLVAKVEFLPAVASFLREISNKLGLAGNDIGRLELVVEEACMNVIEHAFDPDEQGYFDVVILRKPGQVVVAVEDQGLPFDFRKFDVEKESGIGTILMKAFADEIHFLNLGRRGKRVELVKNLPYKDVEAYISEEEKDRALPLVSVPKDVPITIRLMKPDDSVDLARCVYRCYGYTYANGDVYFPDRVREFLESGLLIPHVALSPDDEVIGHIAIRKEYPDARIGERGQAVVDPRYRGHGLLNKLISASVENARAMGMYGTYGEAVTAHIYSQKAAFSIGARETGVLLGFTPATMFFKKIQGENRQQRQTAVLLYTRLNEEPCRDVYPPFHHQTVIRRIYERNNLRRSIMSALDVKEPVDVPPSSQVDVRVQADASRAFMLVKQYGADLEELVKFRLRELCLRRIDCIYIDLPLSHPATQKFCASLEMLGFFFAGIIPEMSEGDVLRLQYLNNVDVDLANTQIASDFGKELLDYVTKARGA